MKQLTIVWDWNGTLLDDVALNCDIMNRMLRKRQKAPIESLQEYRKIFGFPIQEYYRRAGFDFVHEDYETVADEYMALYEIDSMECRLFPGVEQALAQLKQWGFRQIILSASLQDCLAKQLSRVGISSSFDRILALSNCLAHSKTQLALDWAAEQGISGDQLLFVGDTVHDYEVSRSVGGSCLLIAGGHQDREQLLSCGCPVVEDISEAAQWIKQEYGRKDSDE